MSDHHMDTAKKYLDRGLTDAALAAFGLALEKDPKIIDAHMGMGDIYRLYGDYELALRAYERVIHINPNHFSAHYYLALMRQMLGHLDEAIVMYLRALAIDPHNFAANRDIAATYRQLGQNSSASQYAERATELAPDSQAAQVSLAATIEVPDANHPLADPVLHANAVLTAQKAIAWTEGTAQILLLEHDSTFEIGVYGFQSRRAVARIDTQYLPGKVVRHLSIYLEMARPITGTGPVQADAPHLLVTASTTGKVHLKTDLIERAHVAPDQPLVAAAAQRVAQLRQSRARPLIDAPAEPLIPAETFKLRDNRRRNISDQRLGFTDQKRLEAKRSIASSGQGRSLKPEPFMSVLPRRGAVFFRCNSFAAEPHGDQSALMLFGDVKIAYQDYEGQRSMSLGAERIVLFVEGDWTEAIDRKQFKAERIQGIYLEDNVVVTDGAYTVRAPQVFYDPENDRAILLDAVMYAYDIERQVPLYLRAKLLRQRSATSFEAEQALLTTSEFAEPHFAIGVQRVIIEQFSREDGSTSQRYEAQGITARVGDTPIGWWPAASGEARDTAMVGASSGYSSDDGASMETTWDLFALAGRMAPNGVHFEGNLDYQGQHGPGMGMDLTYNLPEFFGNFNTYLIPKEMGEDNLGSGRFDIAHKEDARGFIQMQHRQYLPHGIELSMESAIITDETFLEEYFSSETYAAKEYETSVYLKKQKEDWALTLLTRYDLTDFVPQLTVLQAPGYTVDKLPELGLFLEGLSLWNDRLTYYSESRVSHVKVQAGDDTPADRGFAAPTSASLFGITPANKFATRFPVLPTNWVSRLDTRHEIDSPLIVDDWLNITPYVTGRLTAYDQDFEDFSGEEDKVRLWGQVGTRVHTQFHRSYEQLQNELLYINGLRHIIEPNINIYTSSTTIDSNDLPVFDSDVEPLNKGSGLALGARNTLQTRRGGDGQWRTVDWIVLETRYLFAFDEDNPRATIPRYFDYRPEFSVGGDHLYSQLLWMVTEQLGLTGELTWDSDASQVVVWRLNTTMDHAPRFSSYIGYGEIDALGSQLLRYGFAYQLTTKYTVAFGQTLDFGVDKSRRLELVLERRLPQWRAQLVTSFDEIDDDTFVGLELNPEGFGSPNRPLRWP